VVDAHQAGDVTALRGVHGGFRKVFARRRAAGVGGTGHRFQCTLETSKYPVQR
jgi:hypothetical protein